MATVASAFAKVRHPTVLQDVEPPASPLVGGFWLRAGGHAMSQYDPTLGTLVALLLVCLAIAFGLDQCA